MTARRVAALAGGLGALLAPAPALGEGTTIRPDATPEAEPTSVLDAAAARPSVAEIPEAGSARASVFGGLNEPGMAAGPGDGTPPDATGAIGLTHYVEMTNFQGVAVYDRETLAPVSGPTSLASFVGTPANGVSDPQIQWDQNWGRWIYAMGNVESASQNFLSFGWSKTADPTDLAGGWCHFTIDTGGALDDNPKLGHSNPAITIGANRFGAEFVTAVIHSISKPADPTACEAPTVGTFGSAANPLLTADGDVAFAPVPANAAGSSPGGYVVAADTPLDGPNRDQIMSWRLNGGGAAATLNAFGNIGVPAYDLPADVPQPSSSFLLDSGDARLTNGVAAFDPAMSAPAVWTQHTIDGPGGRSVVRWYELLPETQTVRQRGEISDPSHFVFNGAISPSAEGNAAAVTFNRGSSTLLADMHAQSRDSETPLGEMRKDVQLGTSQGAAQDSSCAGDSICRWGDHAGASPDPFNRDLVWGSNQGLATPSGTAPRWTTRNFALFTDVTAPTVTFTGGPSGPTRENMPAFEFAGAEAGASFACQTDGGAFAACDSPRQVGPLPEGPHSFGVRATDAAGNVGPTRTRSFTVDRRLAAVSLKARKTQKQSGRKLVVKAKAKAGEEATASVSGSIELGGKDYALEKQTLDLEAGEAETVKLQAAKEKQGRKVLDALGDGAKAKVSLRARIADPAGNEATRKAKVKLRG